MVTYPKINESLKIKGVTIPNRIVFPPVVTNLVANPNEMPPYERLYGKDPPIEHLRVLGCECWKPRPRTKFSEFTKLDSRADKCYLLGYSATHQYRVWNSDTKRVELVRDLDFKEDTFSQGEHIPETVGKVAALDDALIQDTLAHRAKRLRSSTFKGETFMAIQTTANDGGLVLVSREGVANEQQRLPEDPTPVAQSIAALETGD